MQISEPIKPGAVPVPVAVPTAPRYSLSLMRNIKIGTFHIGSSMADILASGVWNRIMIKELGFAATPVALLLALRYFLAPFSVWVGQRSDVRPFFGYHRLPYIWFGRFLMVFSYVLLGLATLELAGDYHPIWRDFVFDLMPVTIVENADSFIGWAGVVVSLVMFSVGSTISGTTFLSLVHDVSPRTQRTRAVSVVWFFLILGFAVSGIIYSRLLPEYTREGFLSLFLIAPLIMGSIFFFSLLGEEKPVRQGDSREGADKSEARPFWQDMKVAWSSIQTRRFFLFLALSTIFFYTQDVILEPFAAQVFNMSVATTSRFATYWGSMTLLGIVVSLILARRIPHLVNNMSLSRWGVITLIVTFILFVVCATLQIRPLVTIGLIVMGIGLGMWTVGSLGLMMDMTRSAAAGLYLSIWTVASTLARGGGIVLGGVALDAMLALTGGQQAVSYAAVFALQAAGFAYSLWVLRQLDVKAFAQETPASAQVMAATMD